MSPDIDIRISWSGIRNHEECRQRSSLLRAGKRNPLGNLRSYFHGMVVDRACRDWLADPARVDGGMLAMIDSLIDTEATRARESGDGIVKWKSPGDRGELRAFCAELVQRLEPMLYEHVLPYPFQAGLRFAVPVSVPYLDGTPTTIHLVGEMDILVDHDGYRPLDLKGTKDGSYWRKVVGQLVFYDLAVMLLHQRRCHSAALIQPMCTQPYLQFVFTDDDRRAMWARIIAMASDIWRGEASCTTDVNHCTFCSVRHACARFTPAAPFARA